MTEVVFRPRLGPYVIAAALMTFAAYIALSVMTRDSGMPYPFGVAALIGGSHLAWNLVANRRRHGLRVDATGISDRWSQVTMGWAEITAIRLELVHVKLQKGEVLARIARLEAGDKVIRFADLGPGRPPRIDDIANLDAAGLLLAIATSRSGATALYPAGWQARHAEPEAAVHPAPARHVEPARVGGLVALLVKAGPKLGAIVMKLAKSLKLGSVVVSIGVYSLIMSWKFAVALVGMIAVHECGHAYAMWRSGVPVKGIYFVPFFGGAAVSSGIAKTRARTAYIAINGPIWGSALAVVCFAAFALGGGEHRFLGTLAAWGAFINLFNLMPMFPLDGGRIAASLVHASPRARPALVAILVAGAAIAYFSHLDLLVLVGILGLFEVGGRLQAATFNPGFVLLGEHRLGPDEHEHFAHHVAYVESGRDAPAKVEQRRQLFERTKAEAEQTPMTLRQSGYVLAGYAALIVLLISMLVLTTDIAGAGSPLDLLH